MPETRETECRPIMGYWQTKSLIELLDKFYSDPKNRAAYEKWKAERESARAKEAN